MNNFQVKCMECGGPPSDFNVEVTASERLVVTCGDCGTSEVWG